MAYADSFAPAAPTANRAADRAHAGTAAALFHRRGALLVVECWGDDAPEGKRTDFPCAGARAADETVAVGRIEWRSKAVRYTGRPKIMADPLMDMAAHPMPFVGKRMIHGGFDIILDAHAPSSAPSRE